LNAKTLAEARVMSAQKGLQAKYKKNGLQYQTGGHKAAVW